MTLVMFWKLNAQLGLLEKKFGQKKSRSLQPGFLFLEIQNLA